MAVVIDGTTGISTPAENVLGNLSYTGTLTGNGGVINLGSGQVYKDASGNVGIGTSSPNQKLVVKTVDGGGIATENAAGTQWRIAVNGDNSFSIVNSGVAERARIDSSGNLLVGTTSQLGSARVTIKTPDGSGALIPLTLAVGLVSDGFGGVSFRNPNGAQGSININSTSVSYNTTSDYRLKEAIAPMTGALAKVALLKPVTYKWKVDGSDGQGFIAHELAEVVAGCVTGEKDAVDADGNPQYQGIDTSFLVATLAAAIQEQQTLITALTARITALETAA